MDISTISNIAKELSAVTIIFIIVLAVIKLTYDYFSNILNKKRISIIESHMKEKMIMLIGGAKEEFKNAIAMEIFNKFHTKDELNEKLDNIISGIATKDQSTMILNSLLGEDRVREIIKNSFNSMDVRAIFIDITRSEVDKILRELKVSDDKIDEIKQRLENDSRIIVNIKDKIDSLPMPRLRE